LAKVVIFLQNAWSGLFTAQIWPRDSWLKALHRSRSGQRLKILTDSAPGCEFWFDNTTEEVAEEPNGICPPDIEHVKDVLKVQRPEFVVACGKQAAKVLLPLFSPLLIIPHPAHRLVTNDLYRRAGELLVEGFEGVITLEQKKGKYVLSQT
jgi:hypothetical protein